MSDQEPIDPTTTRACVDERKQLSPETFEAFKAFSLSVFADDALHADAKQLIAIAVPSSRTASSATLDRPYDTGPGRSDHGSNLGLRRNARRGRLRSFGTGDGNDRTHANGRLQRRGDVMPHLKPAELVRLTQDLPELGLHRGDVGSVCSTWFEPNTAFEVEFQLDGEGSRVRALLMPNQIQKDVRHTMN